MIFPTPPHLAAALTAALALPTLAAPPASAAEIALSTAPGCAVTLSGPIVAGDAERLRGVLAEARRAEDIYDCAKNAQYSVCLDSDGGTFTEAQALAREIRAANFPTRVPAGARCTSACAFAFMAGRYGGEEGCDSIVRTLDIDGALGFHAPYVILEPSASYSGQAINDFLPIYNGMLAEFASLSADRSSFELKPTVSLGLWTEFLSTPPDQMYMIDTVEKAARWSISLSGIPETRVLTEDDQVQACVNQLAWAYDGPSRRAADDEAWGPVEVPNAPNEFTRYTLWNLGGMFRRDCFIEDQSAQVDPSPQVAYCLIDSRTGLQIGDCEGENGLDLIVTMPWWHALPPDTALSAIR